jgi:hypothetical protein
MSIPEQKSVDKAASWVTVIVLPAILLMATWVLGQIVDHGQRIAVIESENAKGPRYTRFEGDALEDRVEDHEVRIRTLESARP